MEEENAEPRVAYCLPRIHHFRILVFRSFSGKAQYYRENQSQYKLAFISIPLNIAEGAGKQTGKIKLGLTTMREDLLLRMPPAWMFFSR